jgi:mannose-P-dolichol utilization defect protein 1
MKFLLDMPFVMSIAALIWGEESSVSPDVCVGGFPFMLADCWSQLVVKGLGVGIILGSCLNKAPIMINVIRSGSAAGLSKSSLYGDALILANSTFYGLLSGFPITSYGENIALLIQSLVIILLTWKYSDVSLQEKAGAITAAAVYVIAVTHLLPERSWHWLMASIWPLLVYSRGAQIRETYKVEHTGANSILTTATNIVGGFIRIFTTIAEVGWDLHMLFGYILGVSLNTILAVQYFWYLSNTSKFMSDLKAKKKD